MEYNTQKKQLIIPEYGRNIHTMVEHCKKIEDKQERNQFAESLIDIMGCINPHLRDVTDFQHKLWDQLFIMADFDLDVDSPYPKPLREEIQKKPERLTYSKELKTYRYYGKITLDVINVLKTWEEGEKKDAAILALANQMKRSYINWNRDEVDNEVIAKDLLKLSEGQLTLKNPEDLIQKVEKLNHNIKPVRKSKNKKIKRK